MRKEEALTMGRNRITWQVWKFKMSFEGFSNEELNEIQNEFDGAVEKLSAREEHSILHEFVRIPEKAVSIDASKCRQIARHKGGSSSEKFFSDGRKFDLSEQNRFIGCAFENDTIACYGVSDAAVVASKRKTVVVGEKLEKYLLTDLIENIMLCEAKENNWIQCHGAAWVRNEKAHIAMGDSGAGKTTALFREVLEGATFLSNDRIFLKMEEEKLYALSFPLPVNVGCGTIRSLRVPIQHYSYADNVKIRLTPREVSKMFNPNYGEWYEVAKIYSPSIRDFHSNVYWIQDPSHPFWNKTQIPAVAKEQKDMKNRMESLVESASFR